MAAVGALQLNMVDNKQIDPLRAGQQAAAPACEGLARELEPVEPSVEPSAAESKGAELVEVESHSSCSGGAEDCSEGVSKQQVHQAALAKKVVTRKTVHFASVEITAMWVADSVLDYNRRSIVVDLSKTPFALFRRDAVMMKQARATIDPSAPLPPPGLPALPAQQDSPAAGVGRTTAAISSSSSSAADSDVSPSSSPSPPQRSSGRRRPSDKPTRVWDSESSESSEGHTDWETDDTETDWHSDADSTRSGDFAEAPSPPSSSSCLVDQQLRRGSNTEGPAFYGVWKRTSSEGYEELLLKSGVPKRAVSLAVAKHPVHIIDHDGSYFRLIVKNGLSKVDNTFFIGDEPKQDIIGKHSYEVSMNWAHMSGHGSEDELALTSICDEMGEEVIAIRSLEDGGNRMVLTQIVRRPAENYEVRAKHFFKRVTNKSELSTKGREKKKNLSSNVVTVRRKK